MAGNDLTPHASHCVVHWHAPQGIFRDSDLRDGKVVAKLEWTNGPIEEVFSRPTSATALVNTPAKAPQRAAKTNWAWNPFATGWGVDADGGYSTTGASNTLNIGPDGTGDFDRTDGVFSIRATLGSAAGVLCRQGANGHWRAVLDASVGFPILVKRTASPDSTVTMLTGPTPITAGTEYEISVRVEGNNFEMFLDGVSQGTITDSTFNTYTGTRIFTTDSTSRFTSFKVLPLVAVPSGLTSYEVLNADGVVVDSGSVTSDEIEIDDDLLDWRGNGKMCGYTLHLIGATVDANWGTSYGDGYFIRVPEHAGLFPDEQAIHHPSLPAAGDGWHNLVHNRCGMGPIRYVLDVDGSNTTKTLTGATLDTAQWVDFDPGGRDPRLVIGHFNQGQEGDTAAVTSIVNSLKSVVKVWEGLNEPNIEGYESIPSEVASYITLAAGFYAAVKAADPDAIVLGPNPVSINRDANSYNWMASWFAQGGYAYCDAISYHAYNVSLGDLSMTRRCLEDLRGWMTEYSVDLPIWQTENGAIVNLGHTFQGRRGARYEMMRRFVQELYGVPYEHDVRWYDIPHGFPSVPFWWYSASGGVAPMGALTRVHAAETFNRPLVEQLDFGSAADLYAGGLWADAEGTQVVGVLAASHGLPDIRLAVSGASTVTAVDPWGNESTLTVTAGTVTMPVYDLPAWVRAPAGVTVELIPVDWDWGTNLALAMTPSTTGSATNLAKINDGVTHENSYYRGTGLPASDVDDPYNDDPEEVWPQTITLTTAGTVTGTRVVVKSFPAWQTFVSSWVDFDVEVRVDGVWTAAGGDSHDPSTSVVPFIGNKDVWGQRFEDYWDARWAWIIDLPSRMTFDAVRFVINETSYGGHPTDDIAQWIWFRPGIQERFVTVKDLEVYDTFDDSVRTVLLLAAS